MQLRQDIQRNDESIATVDYRLVERVAEIDESFDTFDARVSMNQNQCFLSELLTKYYENLSVNLSLLSSIDFQNRESSSTTTRTEC